MNEQQMKDQIAQSIQNLAAGNAAQKLELLFQTLGYTTQRKFELDSNHPEDFIDTFGFGEINQQRASLSQWKSVDFLFQLTEDEIKSNGQLGFSSNIDQNYLQSYIFLAVELRETDYTRSQLSDITREVNRQSDIPIMILFRHGEYFTLSIINRRPHKRATSKDVLEKITLIKNINIFKPHRAHIEILFDLSLPQLFKQYQFTNFDQLHDAWQKTLDTSELNKRFFKEVANWYFWAVQNVTLPQSNTGFQPVNNQEEHRQDACATFIIRLITRLIFVWFLKEKRLLPDDLFNYQMVQELIKSTKSEESTYYKAILQNLFFATLNQEMNTPSKPDNRKFRNKAKQAGGRDQNYMVHNVYRYEDYFHDSQAILRLFDNIPFLNGGLFECLDKPDGDNPKQIIRIDGFSDRKDNLLNVPNFLFFNESEEVDLNDVYGTKNKHYRVRGLINIFHSYKFTITENTPIEEEIALDPELLGKVFENLLAAYNPETNTTARKQTGSFYTPREIVDYMVDEALIAYLEKVTQASSLYKPSEKVTQASSLYKPSEKVTQASSLSSANVEHKQDACVTLKRYKPSQNRQNTYTNIEELGFFDPDTSVSITARNLPHWQQDGVTYFVTFRLADSVPQEKLRQWQDEREKWLKENKQPFSKAQKAEYYQLFSEKINNWLDAGMGSCYLKEPHIAKIVADALHYFNGDRYILGEWVVMPNHVHLLVTPLGDRTLSAILHSWKSFTANQVNKVLNRQGKFWQEESFDHIVRNHEQLERIQQYIAENPQKAGIKVTQAFSLSSANVEHKQDACATKVTQAFSLSSANVEHKQ
ncbi:transposase, partial [Microcoleus anatoxicus]